MAIQRKYGRKSKRKRTHWMKEKRTWIVYAMSPDLGSYDRLKTALELLDARATGPLEQTRRLLRSFQNLRLYIGIVSVKANETSGAQAVQRRRNEHARDAHERGSKCPLHVAMRTGLTKGKWRAAAQQVLKAVTYHEAMKREKQLKARFRPHVHMLNRRSLTC